MKHMVTSNVLLWSLQAKPLPCQTLTPDDPTIGQKTGDNPPALGFTLIAPDSITRNNFNCFNLGLVGWKIYNG